MQNKLGAPRYSVARLKRRERDEEKEAASMLEDHEGLEVMKMGQMRLWIECRSQYCLFWVIHRGLKQVSRVETPKTSIKAQDLICEKRMDSKIRTDRMGSKMQIENCPSTEDQSRFSV